MKKTRQGISLIVLVITIIVMIILAATIIISLNNAGVINKANDAVNKTNTKQVQHIATLAWTDAYADGKREQADLQAAVDAALEASKIDKNKYNVDVTEKGVTVTEKEQVGDDVNEITPPTLPEEWKTSVRELTSDGVPIPIGFAKSPYDNEGTKAEGLVIYALTEEEISDNKTELPADEDYQTSLENRNQFVWVPVDSDKFETLFKRYDYINATSKISYNLGTNYWELILTADNMPADSTLNTSAYMDAKTLLEATNMYASVKKYGGFYIGRYEIGSSEVNSQNYGRGTASVTMGKYPLNNIQWSESSYGDSALTAARGLYPTAGTTYGAVSTLVYGVQWDRTLAWWQEQDKTLSVTDSSAYGRYSDTLIAETDLNEGAEYATVTLRTSVSNWDKATAKTTTTNIWLMTTGAYEKAQKYNIYDMAGNVVEWTMEGNGTAKNRNLRGGDSANASTSRSVAYREPATTKAAEYEYLGARAALYIK